MNKKALLLSFLPPLIVSIAIAWWYVKPLQNEVFLGLCQWEQVVYLATAREVVENGWWIFYPSPYAIESDFPKIYSHLMQVLLGYAWHFTGIPLTALWWMCRILLGPLMFYLGYKILKEFFNGIYLKIGFLMLMFGGGLAYFHAFFGSLVFGKGFLESWRLLESPYDWWFTNIFRVTFYPLEIFAHVMLFSSILFFIRKRFAFSAFFYFLTWWSHPIPGAMLTMVYGVFFFIETLFFKGKPRHILFILIACLFLWYYLIFIPSLPMPRELAENFKSAAFFHLNPLLYLSAWGIFIILPFLIKGNFGAKERFVLYWALVELVLINHDLIFPEDFVYQPMHFTRGNFFFPLLILSLIGLKRLGKHALFFFFVLSLPDNIIFIHQFMSVGGDNVYVEKDLHLNPLRLSDARWDVLNKLSFIENETILSYDIIIGVMIPAYTSHRTLLGHPDYVPHRDEKIKDAKRYFDTLEDDVLKKYNITLVVFPSNVPLPKGEIYHKNSEYVVIKPNL